MSPLTPRYTTCTTISKMSLSKSWVKTWKKLVYSHENNLLWCLKWVYESLSFTKAVEYTVWIKANRYVWKTNEILWNCFLSINVICHSIFTKCLKCKIKEAKYWLNITFQTSWDVCSPKWEISFFSPNKISTKQTKNTTFTIFNLYNVPSMCCHCGAVWEVKNKWLESSAGLQSWSCGPAV